MGAWKTYAWEKDTFRWHWRVRVKPEFRVLLTQAMAERFGIKGVSVRLTDRTWAHASVGFLHDLITLPNARNDCKLGMICHEVAHLVNWRLYKGRGHTGTFKRALIKVMIEAKPMLPSLFAHVRSVLHSRALETERQAQRADREAQRLRATRDLRKTTTYRIGLRRAQIKRLETRIKRLQTATKRARRSLAALERAEARRVSESVPGDTHRSEPSQS